MTHDAPSPRDHHLARSKTIAADSPPTDPAPAALRFENAYVWFVFVSALDLMFTWIILHLGGVEVNAIADAVIRTFDLWGLIGFKFALVVLVIVICEEVARHREPTGRLLARAAVAISSIPVVVAVAQLGAAFIL